jgi:hypothetical protein
MRRVRRDREGAALRAWFGRPVFQRRLEAQLIHALSEHRGGLHAAAPSCPGAPPRTPIHVSSPHHRALPVLPLAIAMERGPGGEDPKVLGG